ncbi:MAG TPA: hypothetical protein VJU82_12125 [Acidobacteriaceae bacterium]|nr:hypothetical protein [Acidobacteriaceae bacterium]
MLFVLASTASWGGALLIAEARRNPIGQLPLNGQAHGLFNSGLLLGMMLFGAIGVPGVWALWVNLRQERNSAFWSALEGVVLLGWLVAECLYSRTLLWLHYVYGAMGVYLIACGWVLSSSRYRLEQTAHGDSAHSIRYGTKVRSSLSRFRGLFPNQRRFRLDRR